MAGALARVARGELPAYKVFEGAGWLGVLDIHPATPGHVLVISTSSEVDQWTDLPDSMIGQAA
jgi:diadenosine tetraphosphate (Ap4A) HIT family hydrolase